MSRQFLKELFFRETKATTFLMEMIQEIIGKQFTH